MARWQHSFSIGKGKRRWYLLSRFEQETIAAQLVRENGDGLVDIEEASKFCWWIE